MRDKAEQNKSEHIKEPRYRMVRGARYRAKQKGLECSITIHDFEIPKICPILNIPLKINDGVRGMDSPTIDRIDNSKGYTKDNVRVISWKANTCKRDLSLMDIQRMYKYSIGEI